MSVFTGSLPAVLVLLPDGQKEYQAPDDRSLASVLRKVGEIRGMLGCHHDFTYLLQFVYNVTCRWLYGGQVGI